MPPAVTIKRERSLARIAFWRALILAVTLHAAFTLLVLMPPGIAEDKLETLGYLDLIYDPLGGEPGGDLPDASQNLEPPLLEPEPEPEPEEPEIIPEDELTLIESVSEKADEAPPPPPPLPEEPKPQPKPKPKPKPKPAQTARAAPASASQAGGTPGTGGGGGPGLGQGGAGGGTGRGTADALAAYKSQVRRKIERNRKYPPSARNGRIEGTVRVSFTLNRQGQVVSFRMVNSSGHPILDDEAAALIRRVSPMPAFPKELTISTLELTVPIKFALR